MKSIKMIFFIAVIGMIFATSCSTESAEQLQQSKMEKEILNSFQSKVILPELEGNSWYTYEKINGVDYYMINGEEKEKVVSVIEGCEACKASCWETGITSGGAHIIKCSSGREYYAVNCNDGAGWHVNLTTYYDSNGIGGINSPYAC